MRQMQSPVHYRFPSPLRAPFCVCLLAFEYPSAGTVNTILAHGVVILHTHTALLDRSGLAETSALCADREGEVWI